MSRGVAWTVVVACWLGAAAASIEVARRTRVGFVLIELGPRHGVHIGDVLAVTVAAGGALAATWILLRSPDRAAPPRSEVQ